ncbi:MULTISPECIES: RrF2 family transcriptional regulator [Bacillus]|uniref:HTH-type transcriptional regulator NsrR n=2 Tax=Bacillus TaxID=1386 RepID=A0A0M4FNT3_9BACI|nr:MULTISPECIES: Rrf2 family transcriptional regulator [Bacillus]ALC80334.1 Rrf2 family transcriptional regulator [Bacillus gobiensis]MBP1083825.1 Rrf2 family nitric oxide-sensitive transcriptional repressor [Bacillus capparidis]MED1098308.1 Rrf2 family transcriptional regulator [Bacillus capparidis]
MRLTNYTDYSLRVLIYLSLQNGEKLSNIKDIADSYQISKNHLMKVTHELGKLGYIETIRGRNGGVRLAKHPREINIGEVVSKTEEDFHLVECFNKETSHCALTPSCKLRHALAEALQAFIDVLKKYTLEDLVHNRDDLRKLLGS